MKLNHYAAGLACVSAILAFEHISFAANPPCLNTGLPGAPVIFAGSSAAKPMLKAISQTLATAQTPVRLIYISLGSCAGLADVTMPKKETTVGSYWDSMGNELMCDNQLDAMGNPNLAGNPVDVGISDVFPASCSPPITLMPNQTDFTGSAQIFGVVVPPSSKANAISMEALAFVYGWGAMMPNVLDPWTDPNYVFRRGNTSGTYTMTSKLTGLDINKFKGIIPGNGKSGDILTAVANANSTAPDKAIGVLSADFFDANRSGMSAVKLLAYQHKGADCGIYPDSSKDALDKLNVRLGVYRFWGPVHYVTNSANGKPANPIVASALSYFTRDGLSAADKKTMIDNEVKAFTVPQCAMSVKRTGEVAPSDGGLVPYTPDEPCGCYYEYKATNATKCTTCMNDTACGAGKCRYGYCEAK